MRGIVVKFDRERGFGFIRLQDVERDVFFHIKDVEGRTELVPGQSVRCDIVDTDKGPAAKHVIPGSRQNSPVFIYLCVSLIVITGAVLGGRHWEIPVLLGYLAGVNGATLLLYGYDKAIAGSGALRVPEAVLHGLAFGGGTPAALVSQLWFRHKTRKIKFRLLFWLVVAIQMGLAWGWYYACSHQPDWIPQSYSWLFPNLGK